MPFRERQRYKIPGSTNISYIKEIIDPDTGEVHEINEDIINKELPKPELFDLKTQLKAGIEQEEVKSQILTDNNVNIDKVIRKYTKRNKTNGNESE